MELKDPNITLALQYMNILINYIQHDLINYKIVKYNFIYNYLSKLGFDEITITIIYNEYVDFILLRKNYKLNKINI